VDYDIFLSYRRADQVVARKVVEALEARGLRVWWDQKIEGGEDWRDAIVDNLTRSAVLVILFSEDCNDSKQLRKELAIADTMDKEIVPVLIEDTQPKGHFLYELASRNWIQIHPHPERKGEELAQRLESVVRNASGEAPEPPAAVTSAPTSKARAQRAEKVVVQKRRRDMRKAGMRDILPLRWIDVPLVGLLSLAITMSLEPTHNQPNDIATWFSVAIFVCLVLALYCAIIFPVRYYMRKRRFWRAVSRYFLSSLLLYAFTFGVYLVGTVMFELRNFGGPFEFCTILAGIWIFLGVVAFVFYAILAAQRAMRSFRSNVETI
jgi:hypothetical protein